MAIKTVAVAGGTGNVGAPIVAALVEAGFAVTLLSRDASKITAPAGVAGVRTVDYGSVASLTAALQGQDAVVSTLASAAVGDQGPLVDAAAAAGVRRFVPSEFGIDTRATPGHPIGRVLAGKTATVARLAAAAAADRNFTWTGLATGVFFDWGLPRGVAGLDKAARAAAVVDSGDERFQASNLAFVGRAVAAVLARAGTDGDPAANQYLAVASFTPTQNELLAYAEAATGGAPWTVRRVAAADLQRAGEEKLRQGDRSAFGDLLKAWNLADGAGHAPDLAAPDSGNRLLGLAPEDPAAAVQAWLAEPAA